MPIANKVLMVRPAKFYSNPETAIDNSFQKYSLEDLTLTAQKEFDKFVVLLRNAGVSVSVIQDSIDPETPDSIFPNNRISFAENGVVVVYPMKAINRRKERQLNTLSILEKTGVFKAKKVIDYSVFEEQEIFLEGTGSIIFDRKNKFIYAAKSQRTNEILIKKLAKELGYECLAFNALVKIHNGSQPIYHTNVMLAIAETFIIIAEDVIDSAQRTMVLQHLMDSGRKIISITTEQMKQFCGNILQLQGEKGNKIIVMSKTARESFTPEQIALIKEHNEIVVADVPVIERASGGSVRCMLAEIF